MQSSKIGYVTNLTDQQYFAYCKIAYLHSNLKLDASTKNLSGKELYKLFADCRHEGLLDIKQNSVEEFKQWLDGKHPKRNIGGHPWEILRGGNTTKISLYVSKENYAKDYTYKLTLNGNAINRLAERITIFLALHKQNYPVAIRQSQPNTKQITWAR